MRKIIHVLEEDELIINEDILVTNDNIKSIEVESYEIITNEVAINEEETSLIQNEVEEDNQEDFSPTFDWSLFDDTSTTEVENSEEYNRI